jgi:hypothetical protein
MGRNGELFRLDAVRVCLLWLRFGTLRNSRLVRNVADLRNWPATVKEEIFVNQVICHHKAFAQLKYGIFVPFLGLRNGRDVFSLRLPE